MLYPKNVQRHHKLKIGQLQLKSLGVKG